MKQDGSMKTVVTAFFANLFVTIIKFIGWMVSASPSMLAEAMHTAGDTLNQFLVLIGTKKSRVKGNTADHNYGVGSFQYIFNFSAAIGVFALGSVFTIYHAIGDYFHPTGQSTDYQLNIAIIILFISLGVEGYSFIVALKEVFKAKGQESLISYLKHSDDSSLMGIFLEDGAAVAGLLIALVGMILSRKTGSNIPDIIAAISIGIMMGIISIHLLIHNTKLLLGKSIRTERVDELKDFIESLESVDKVFKIKTEILGTKRVHLAVTLEFHGMAIIKHDREQFNRDVESIFDGENPANVLSDVINRTVRIMGKEIMKIENQIKEKFPEVSSIDLELGDSDSIVNEKRIED